MVVTITAGLFLVIIGIVIWQFKLVGLFVSKQSGHEADRPGLARWIGSNLIIMGIVVSVFAVIQMLLLKKTYPGVDFVIILVLSTRMAFGTAKFNRPPGKSAKRRKSKNTK